MFEQPNKSDIDRALSVLMHEAHHDLAARRNKILSEATKAGALGNSRLNFAIVQEADAIHKRALDQGISTLVNFAQRMDTVPTKIMEWARFHLEDLGNSLLRELSPSDLPAEHKQVIAQYRAKFSQRLTDALRDIEIGFVKGVGFNGSTKQNEWVNAAEAIEMLKPVLAVHSARIRICERAHAGLIRARAEQFHQGDRVLDIHDIPKQFWWAEGHEALGQDWVAGDFSTWIRNGSVQLKAFGVTFARNDIAKILPPASSIKAETNKYNEEDEKLISLLNALVPSAALSYKQAVLDLNDDSRISFRGPALELRETLREILSHLAPDDQVIAQHWYKPEKNTPGPTQRQRVRFALKGRNQSSIELSEQAINLFEETIEKLTRATYELSSKATHISGERGSVAQIRRCLIVIFHEILEK